MATIRVENLPDDPRNSGRRRRIRAVQDLREGQSPILIEHEDENGERQVTANLPVRKGEKIRYSQ